MKTDPIVDEVHAARQKIAAKFGNDLGAYIADLREREKIWGDRVITLRQFQQRKEERRFREEVAAEHGFEP